MLLTVCHAAGGILGREVAAGPVVVRIFLALQLFLAHLLQTVGRAEAGIGVPLFDQFLCILGVDLAAFGLPVGTIRAANVGAFVIVEPEPAQAVHDLLLRAGDGALQIGIFKAQDELSAGLFGEQIIVERHARGGEMHVPRR